MKKNVKSEKISTLLSLLSTLMPISIYNINTKQFNVDRGAVHS